MRARNWAVLLLIVPLAIVPAACGDDADERGALQEDELDRDLDLALRGDSAVPVFQDTAAGVAADPAAAAPPVQAPRTSPLPGQQPARQAPARTQPAPNQPRSPASPAPREESRVAAMAVPTGTTFAVRLNQELSTQSNGVGDPFTATLSEPIVAGDGSTIIPAGATVRGRVTSVNKSDHVGETAVIRLAFESISFGGRSYPLQASVVETNPQKRTRQSTKEQAAKVGASAAAGAIIGQVLGKNTESTVKGAVIGAAAGTAIAMGTADVDVVLPSGSRMVIRLDAPVEVRQAT